MKNDISNSEVHLDPVSLWRLDEAPRFPLTADEWANCGTLPQWFRPQLVGEHSYDLIVNHRARRPVANTIASLIDIFPADFEVASALLNPVQWRTLYYLDQFPVAHLSDPSFAVQRKLLDLCESAVAEDDVPIEWTGATHSTDALLEMLAAISDADNDMLKAVYAILSLARSIGLEKSEVLQLPWHERAWFGGYIAAFQRGT